MAIMMKRFSKLFGKLKKSKSVAALDDYKSMPSYKTEPTVFNRWPPSQYTALPDDILQHIFSFVCPQTQDESYRTCDESNDEDGCNACALRDLSHCAQVSKEWRKQAIVVLYRSIRIDAVHYCELEEILANKRKRKSHFNRNAEPEDVPAARLRLLNRTLREDPGKASYTEILKISYMTREICKMELASLVAVCPKLRYCDLPDGFFHEEPSTQTLRIELEQRCPDIRKMKYGAGSERALERLAGGHLWSNLEVLELINITANPSALRHALGALPNLRKLKIADVKTLNDEFFYHYDELPPFPTFSEIVLENTPNVSIDGLVAYLFRSETQEALKSLSLNATGVQPSSLQQILAAAHRLEFLSVIETVSTPLPIASPEPLTSNSLQTLHYEITSASSANSFAVTTTSYYAYLSTSLVGGNLPALRSLYVRDPDFADTLVDLTPPKPAFARDPDNSSPTFNKRPTSSFSSNNPFAGSARLQLTRPEGLQQELDVYSKGLDEMEWDVAIFKPATAAGRRGSMSKSRPMSSYTVMESLGASGGRRMSVVGNGFGGFLAVPVENRPGTSSGEKQSKRESRAVQMDIWR